MATAPTAATAVEPASAITSRPAASASPAPTMHGIEPKRSGSQPPTTRIATTLAAKAAKIAAPWPIPCSSRCRTTNAAIVA